MKQGVAAAKAQPKAVSCRFISNPYIGAFTRATIVESAMNVVTSAKSADSLDSARLVAVHDAWKRLAMGRLAPKREEDHAPPC